ncbi:inovirus-type Gp2 protein [Citrobacter sp. UYEF32]|uniref:YagK/YfjJ domain-containing protein n=1 Tax=Citrobacter sp. UYEF32 TaxID=3156347 RepID=UPI00339A7C88
MELSESFLSSHAELHPQHIEVSSDNDAIYKTEQLDACLKLISKGQSLPFTVLYNRVGYRQNDNARMLLDAIRYLDMIQKEYLEMRTVNPRIAVFQRLLNDSNLSYRIVDGKIAGTDQVTTAEMLNKLTQDYRHATNTSEFKQEYRKHKRASVKNLKGVQNYIRHLQSRHARLLVLRVDLSWASEYASDITANMAREHRQKLFLDMKKNPIFRHVLGTVWKLEYGPYRKFHYHVLFFLNGDKAQQDVNIARAFGECWKTTITAGKGIYYNCNAHKERYDKCGLGKVHRDDANAQEGLLRAVEYITKIDACARLLLPDNARTFGRGEIKSLKARKRKSPKQNQPDTQI